MAPFVDFFVRQGLSRGTSLIVFSWILRQRISKAFGIMHGSNVGELGINFKAFLQTLIECISVLYDLDKTYVKTKVSAVISFTAAFVSSTFSEKISQLPLILMAGTITILAVYFFLNESDKIRTLFDRYFYFSKTNGEAFIHMCWVCCRQVFFSNIITGLARATIVSIGEFFF